MDDEGKTLITTVDADIHLVDEPLDMVRMKAAKPNFWIKTVDDRLVRSDAVVSVWDASDFEVEAYIKNMSEEQ